MSALGRPRAPYRSWSFSGADSRLVPDRAGRWGQRQRADCPGRVGGQILIPPPRSDRRALNDSCAAGPAPATRPAWPLPRGLHDDDAHHPYTSERDTAWASGHPHDPADLAHAERVESRRGRDLRHGRPPRMAGIAMVRRSDAGLESVRHARGPNRKPSASCALP